ncbi:GGDEF domain-containing protein [Thalassobaculum sp. OXR-137]|uniref:GGDEF domain-containing protein n=1 Tax=Thalassobaculum sp. OXR-137 TaxID=3100173 RepID=UPI002AC9455F|nr:GGDEF domain-containing protein [Thalassobaculum sp. OXR-137]WPZ33482.1 GGDEF domain-containing protein [Thalassobaculum sp. OXR-137]
MTLKGQIVGATLGLAITVAAAIALMVADLVSEQVRDRIGDSLSDLSTEMADRLTREMVVRIAEVEIIANLPALGGMDDLKRARPVIDHLQSAVPEFSWVGILDETGRVQASTGRILEGVDISHRPVFIEGIKDRFIGDVHDAVMLASLLENPTGEPMKFVDIAMPIFDASRKKVGAVAAHLSWTWAKSVELALLQGRGTRHDVDLFVISADGTVLLGRDPSLLGQKVDVPAEAASGGKDWTIKTWVDGKDYVTGYAQVRGQGAFEGFGWVVLSRKPVDVAFKPIGDLSIRIAIIGAIFAALAGGLGWLIASRIAKPVRALSEAANALRLDQTATFPKIRGPREIEILSEAFEDLIETLIAKQTDLDAVTDRAFSDPLTNLGNRAFLENFLATRHHADGAYAVLAIDLDGFKQVNDSHGHEAGDQVLIGVAQRLRGCMRSGDVLVRLGGDEFLAFLGMLDASRDGPARRIALRVVEQISEPFDLAGAGASGPVPARIGASVGVSFYPRDGRDLSEVIKRADSALYAAKRGGKGKVWIHGDHMPVAHRAGAQLRTTDAE